jgi:hypothetical protein
MKTAIAKRDEIECEFAIKSLDSRRIVVCQAVVEPFGAWVEGVPS